MRIIMILLGLVALLAGGGFPMSSLRTETDVALNICVGAAFIAAGVCYVVAAANRYRGHWAFVIGIGLIVLAFIGLGNELEDALEGRSQDLMFKLGLILSFSAAGALSLWSGHKLHRCSLELERFNRSA